MANTQTPNVDYAPVLADLKAKRRALEAEYQEKLEAIDNAIEGIEMVYVSLRMQQTPQLFPQQPIAGVGVYEATSMFLAEAARPLSTQEIAKKLNKESATIAPTLYRAVKEKKDCKIQRFGEGMWGLATWRREDFEAFL